MGGKSNKPTDVFRFIDMKGGDITQCWPWIGGCTGEGRPSFSLGGKKVLPYRVVFELVNGVTIPAGVLYLHQCDNGICCNPHHGRLGSHQENMKEMRQRQRHGLPKHTVTAIKKLIEKGETYEEIAEKFGVDRNTIGRIARGEAYKPTEGGDDDVGDGTAGSTVEPDDVCTGSVDRSEIQPVISEEVDSSESTTAIGQLK